MTRYILAALIALTLATPAATQPQVSGQTNPWSVSKVIGVTVYDPQNEEIGQLSISSSIHTQS